MISEVSKHFWHTDCAARTHKARLSQLSPRIFSYFVLLPPVLGQFWTTQTLTHSHIGCSLSLAHPQVVLWFSALVDFECLHAHPSLGLAYASSWFGFGLLSGSNTHQKCYRCDPGSGCFSKFLVLLNIHDSQDTCSWLRRAARKCLQKRSVC